MILPKLNWLRPTYWEAALVLIALILGVLVAILWMAWQTTNNSLRAYQAQEAADAIHWMGGGRQ